MTAQPDPAPKHLIPNDCQYAEWKDITEANADWYVWGNKDKLHSYAGKVGQAAQDLQALVAELEKIDVHDIWRGTAAKAFMKELKESVIPKFQQASNMHGSLVEPVKGCGNDIVTVQDDVKKHLKSGHEAWESWHQYMEQDPHSYNEADGSSADISGDIKECTDKMNRASRDVIYERNRLHGAVHSWLPHFQEAIEGRSSTVGSIAATK